MTPEMMSPTLKIFERLTCRCCLATQLSRHIRLYSSKSEEKILHVVTPLTFLNLKCRIPSLLKNAGQSLQHEETSSGQIVVYTDGSCLSNNELDTSVRKGGLGVYWGNDDHPYNLSIPHGGSKLSSNRAEIAAAHAGILIAKFSKIDNLCLRTDSRNLVKTFTCWLPRWKATNWVSMSTGRPIKNQDMLKKLLDDLKYVNVEFQHHSDNIEGIQKAHILAQNGANLS